MSVWLCIPSARPPEEAVKVLRLWRALGYQVSLWRDHDDPLCVWPDFCHREAYPGYARAVNELIRRVLIVDPSAEWFVTGGDDVEPDPNHSAEEIAHELNDHFGGSQPLPGVDRNPFYRTWGVMQPTGDRFAGGSIDRIAGSPWMGRAFCQRINQGKGPLWPEYTHMFVDEELQHVALKYGCFWQRPDLTHFHRHFMRANDRPTSHAQKRQVPAHLVKWNTQEHWNESKAIFDRRKAGGFPGSEPLP